MKVPYIVSKAVKQLREKESEQMMEKWRPPPKDWYKANTDAAFKNGTAALAMVIRDEKGRVLQMFSLLTNANSPLEAEFKALEWAMKLTSEEN
ncbi:hypothetical protein FNV43_RR09554 [Rhamnella rubrinervis]|uniref:RNase H type-1 domain-containing protein n=1 Tax=Rhamnella rubrinervis TaxID=2594499 RepID=A0A8K0HAN1_9ROSA|nr:hypothetical protein FNV43_RR09554 [Rhamnella rubrinervis]